MTESSHKGAHISATTHSATATSAGLRLPGTRLFRGHIAELDSIRALGIWLVLLNHFWPSNFLPALFQLGQLGWVAMDAFFVLSGFLITGILVDTRERPDYFRNYYLRRSLRIFPLYYVTLVLAILLLKISHEGATLASFTHEWGSPAWFFFYLGNIKMALLGKWPPASTFGVLWSLQIEEQFYLLFPLAVRYMRLDHLSKLLWCLVFLSPLCRLGFYLWNPNNLVIQNVLLPCHMEGLALGGLIAIRFRSGAWEIPKARLSLLTVGALAVTCIASMLSKPPAPDLANMSTFNRLAGYSLSSWACACLVVWLIVFRGSPYTRIFRTPAIKYLATISYGIYLLHPLVSHALHTGHKLGLHLEYNTLPRFFVVSGLSLAAAALSWHFFERPVARLKDRIAPSLQRGAITTASAMPASAALSTAVQETEPIPGVQPILEEAH